jgi:hypothetical protein
MAIKKVVIEEDVLEVTMTDGTVEIMKDGHGIEVNREEAEKLSQALKTVLGKRKKENEEA